jgi:hypothetical protein
MFELGYRPRVDKRGNKVTSISAPGTGIAFRDVTKLLAPSTSLAKFGKLFGLEQQKAHFPFSALRSVLDLEREGLPSDLSEWESDLTGSGGKAFGPEELAEAQNLFARAGCVTLGDYLKAYLKLDVDILFDATQCWRRELAKVTGHDFIEASKYTISSLSYYAGLRAWERKGHIGTFFPNNSQHYRLLRLGMRG